MYGHTELPDWKQQVDANKACREMTTGLYFVTNFEKMHKIGMYWH